MGAFQALLSKANSNLNLVELRQIIDSVITNSIILKAKNYKKAYAEGCKDAREAVKNIHLTEFFQNYNITFFH